MRKSFTSAVFAAVAALSLSMFVGAPAVQTVFAEGEGLDCPVTFQGLRAALREADAADQTGLDNHYWAVVVNRTGVVCAVAFSGQGRDAQWLLSRMQLEHMLTFG